MSKGVLGVLGGVICKGPGAGRLGWRQKGYFNKVTVTSEPSSVNAQTGSTLKWCAPFHLLLESVNNPGRVLPMGLLL